MIVGSATHDLIVNGAKRTRKIGGVVTYAGMTFQRLEIQPVVVSNVAQRDGRIRQLFAENDIPLFSGATAVTTRFVNIYEGEIRRQKAPSLADPIRLTPIWPFLKSTTHIHLGPLHPDDLHPDCLALLSHFKGKITLDVQGYIRKIRNRRVVPAVSKYLADALRLAHIVKAGSEEMAVIFEKYEMDSRQLQTFFHIDELLVTAGRKGGFVQLANGERIDFKACPVDCEVDATGAGDVLFAVYLIKRIYRELSVEASIQFAAQVAADQVAGRFIQYETLLL